MYVNNKLKITTAKKNIVMSFKPYTEKIKETKVGICSNLGRIRNTACNDGGYVCGGQLSENAVGEEKT